MARLRLSPREMELLIESYRRVKKDFSIVVNNCYVELENDIEFLEEIIGTILAFFLSKGLKKNSEPNELGFELEKLNTKFIKELQLLNDKLIDSKK